MHVLFITDELFPSTDANSRIVLRVIDQLLGYPEVQIDILGRAVSNGARWANDYHGCCLIHTPFRRLLNYQKWNKKLGRLKVLRFIIYPRAIIYRIIRKKGLDNPYIWESKNWLKKKYKNYDIVIAMSMPYYNLEIAATVGDKVPVIFYPLEPIATYNRIEGDFNTKLDYEIHLEDKATKLILTSLIHKDFLTERTKVNEKKVMEAEFPCVINKYSQVTTNHIKSNKISIVYIGRFYPVTREPDFLCNLVDYLPEEYELTIVGGLTTKNYKPKIVEKYLSNMHPSIRCVGFVSPDIADDYLAKADVLVHIGNTQSNIMPSKILDYISTGKPIINICKTHDCPTIALMNNYTLGMVLYEDNGMNEVIAKSIDAFCKSVKGQIIPFDTIQRVYYKYTPEYVGQVFYQAIKTSIEEFNMIN